MFRLESLTVKLDLDFSSPNYMGAHSRAPHFSDLPCQGTQMLIVSNNGEVSQSQAERSMVCLPPFSLVLLHFNDAVVRRWMARPSQKFMACYVLDYMGELGPL